MERQLYIGYIGEGNTDKEFLPQIIDKSFTAVAFDCHTDISIGEIIKLDVPKDSFVEMMVEASKKANEKSIMILCIHADADKKSLDKVMEHKFSPLYQKLEVLDEKTYCKNIVAVIPITETESWMLADKKLFKERINAKDKTDKELELEKRPEDYRDPKAKIEKAITLAQQNKTKRRRHDLSISDLYGELGDSIEIEKLRELSSYREFEENVRNAFIKIGYMRPH